MTLPERVREFLDDDRFATIATTDPDGGARQAVIWYRLDGDEIILNSRVGRRWPSDIAEMARRYHADEPEEAERLIRDRFERQERVSFRVSIEAVHDHLDD